jgi:hypothetical protein
LAILLGAGLNNCVLSEKYQFDDYSAEPTAAPKPPSTRADATQGEDLCVTVDCAEPTVRCGTIADGCGGMMDCGECKGNLSCSGRHHCLPPRCEPQTCGDRCGQVADGCDEMLDCGSCDRPDSGAGQPGSE